MGDNIADIVHCSHAGRIGSQPVPQTICTHFLEFQRWAASEYHPVDSSNPRWVVMDGKGNLWIGTREGLAVFDGQRIRRYDEGGPLASKGIVSLAIGPDGSLWGATGRTIFKLEQESGLLMERVVDIDDPQTLFF